MGFLVFHFVLIQSLDTTEKSLAPCSLHFTIRYLTVLIRSHPRLLFYRLNSHSSLSFFLCGRCSSPFMNSVALCWTLSSTSMSSLCRGAQNWTQYSRGGLTSAEWRGRLTSLDLLATLLLMQPRQLLAAFAARAHCWLMASLLSTRSFSAKLRSIQSSPQSESEANTRNFFCK